jgi:hypothetical protein
MLKAHETLMAIVIVTPQISAAGRMPSVEKQLFRKRTEAMDLNTGLLKIIFGVLSTLRVLTTCHTRST